MGCVTWATPWPIFPPGMTLYPLYRRLSGPQGRSGRVRKISSQPGFDHRTVQPVASRYTDWVLPAHKKKKIQDIRKRPVVLILHFTGKGLIWLTYQPSETTEQLTYKCSFDCESIHNMNWKRISETACKRNLRLHILQRFSTTYAHISQVTRIIILFLPI